MARSKNKAPKKSVNVDAVRREVKKMVDNHNPAPQVPGFGAGFGEAAPGAIRRESPLEQQMGTGKYREMIHDHNKKNEHILDRLPFTFPKKRKVRSHLDIVLTCPGCGEPKLGSEHTVGFICTKCNKFVKADNPEAVSRGYNPDIVVGIHGSASDKLRLKEEQEKKAR